MFATLGVLVVLVVFTVFEGHSLLSRKTVVRGPGWHRVTLRKGSYQIYTDIFGVANVPASDFAVLPAGGGERGPEKWAEAENRVTGGAGSWVGGTVGAILLGEASFSPQATVSIPVSGQYWVQCFTLTSDEQMFLAPTGTVICRRVIPLAVLDVAAGGALLVLVARQGRQRGTRVILHEASCDE